MASQRHLRAANRSIRAAGLDKAIEYSSLCEFLREAAREIDAKGLDGVSARLVSAYMSAQTNVARAGDKLAAQRARGLRLAPSSSAESESAAPAGPPSLSIVEAPVRDPLATFRDKHLAV